MKSSARPWRAYHRVTRVALVLGLVSSWVSAQDATVVITEEAQLLSADIEAEDDFGSMVAIDRRNVVVGVRSDDDFCPKDPDCESGSAYIFQLDDQEEWVEVAKLTASNAEEHGYFGRDVAVYGDTVVVGSEARNEHQGGTYVFERDLGGTDAWGERVMLLPTGTDILQDFGFSVSIYGDTLVSSANLIDKAFVFERDEVGDWAQTAEFVGDSGSGNTLFGQFVEIDDETIIVGAARDDEAALKAGAVFVFERDTEGDWVQVVKLVAADPEVSAAFGRNGDIDGNIVAIGAPEKDDACPGDPDCNSGALYIFERNAGGAGQWGQVAKLTPDDGNLGGFYGRAVAVYGDIVVVGAPGDDEGGHVSGAAYVYQRVPGPPGNWILVEKVASADLEAKDRIAYSAAIDGTAIVLGADADTTIFPTTGSAYVFRIDSALDIESTGTCPGTTTLNITGATPDKRVAVFAGLSGGTDSGPGGSCQATKLDIGDARPFGVVTADSSGNATLIRDLTQGFCARALQAVDLLSCRVSSVVAVQ